MHVQCRSKPFSQEFLSLSSFFKLIPDPMHSPSYFSALTGNGFACHVPLVTDCVMDGILVRALLCLRHTVGHKHHHCHLPHCLSHTPLLVSPHITKNFSSLLRLLHSNLHLPGHPYVDSSSGTIGLLQAVHHHLIIPAIVAIFLSIR